MPVEIARDAEGGLSKASIEAEVAEAASIPMLGFDLEIPVLTMDAFQFVPYFDLNSIDTAGYGIHFGTFMTFRFSSLAGALRVRVEYRLASEGYAPTASTPTRLSASPTVTIRPS